MSNETFFRMLSVALLGAVALSCVPDSQAESLNSLAKQQQALTALASGVNAPIEIEIQSLQEVEDINAGRFNPAVAGDTASFADQVEVAAVSAR